MNVIRYRHYTIKAEDSPTAVDKLKVWLEADTRRYEHGLKATITSDNSLLHKVYTVESKRDHHNEPYIAIEPIPKSRPTPRPFDPAAFAQLLQESGRLGTVQVTRKDTLVGGTAVPLEGKMRITPILTERSTRHEVWLLLGKSPECALQYPYVTVSAEAYTLQAAFEEAWAAAIQQLPDEDASFWQSWLQARGMSPAPPMQVDDAPEHEVMTPWALMWQEAQLMGWDRRALAFALGMSVEALARIESGEQPMVWPLARTLEMKLKIAASHWMALEHERTHEQEQRR